MHQALSRLLSAAGRIAATFAMVVAPAMAGDIEQFSPSGEVKLPRQVVVRFTTPMVNFGDPRGPEPFDIDCKAGGSGRWVDAREWVYDFERDVPGGIRCSFRVKPGLVDLTGDAVAVGTREFTTGGPGVRETRPWEGDESIDEQQVFILGLDTQATEASVAKHAWCSIAGRADRVGVRVVTGKERKAVLDRQAHFFDRLRDGAGDPDAFDRLVRERAWDRLPVMLVACRARLPNEAEVQLVWGKGIASADGIETTVEQTFAYRVRRAFTAKFRCDRLNANADCIPVLPMTLEFTAPVSVAAAEKITLTAGSGKVFAPKLSDEERISGFVSGVTFPATYLESSNFRLALPADLVDDAGRPLTNAKRFPITVKTDAAPPLAKFAARFGLLELNADPALAVTVRNVEKTLTGKQAAVTGAAGTTAVAARRLRVQSPRDILFWLKRLDSGEAKWTEGGYESSSIFRPTDTTKALSLPRSPDDKAFEVVGIPLPEPGFHVVELVSPRLGQKLLKEGKPYYVSAGALVTNLAVHFKRGRESSLVWVTTLDTGVPVAGADVAVLDCSGKSYFDGKTDAAGIARVKRALPKTDALPGCRDQWDRQFFVTARRGADASFLLSGWDEGISTWRFNLRNEGRFGEQAVATVFDRTLLRAGDTVGMKHFWRRRTGTGFALGKPAQLPVRAVIQHSGSDQRWELPLAWNADGSAESSWPVPKDAKLGEYSVTLAGPRKGDEAGWVQGERSGDFRVEEFRVPTLRATLQLPAVAQVRPAAMEASVQLTYLSGGGAGGQRVKVRALTQPKTVTFPAFDGAVFANGDVAEGKKSGAEAEADEANLESGATMDADGRTQVLATRPLVLDAGGAARTSIDALPTFVAPRELIVEMEYADPNGQVLTRAARTTLWPSGVLLAVQPDGWAHSTDRVKLRVTAVDPAGKALADVAVKVDAFERQSFSHRKRLIGGFYAYEYGEEIRRLGDFCEGRTNAQGLLVCEAPVAKSGNVILRARSADAQGNTAVARAEAWIAGSDDWWFSQADDDRMDVIPERRRYEPGETAVFQVRSPFRDSTALVTVEREGVLDGFVTRLSGKSPVVKVPVLGHYAPNTFVSVLAVRGRVAGVQPTALVDLGKPAFRLGIAGIQVGWKAHELKVSVKPAQPVYRVRDKVRVAIEVVRADGTKPPKGTEIAVAAVDEALLDLKPNESWKLLDTMMDPRPIEVETSTAAMQVVGKRHFGKKAVAPGGGGGRQSTRELFDTLLLWKPRVKLDDAGRATVDVPLGDSLSAFRIVAIASGGTGMFGTGHGTVRTTQDVQLTSGLPPLVREQDRYSAVFTVRNASAQPLDITVEASVASTPARKDLGATAPKSVSLQPGEARNVSWEVTVPVDVSSLQWTVAAKVAGGEGDAAGDRIRIPQRVIASVPVRTLQATLARAGGDFALPVALPADAIPGRGELRVSLRARLADDLSGVQEYMGRYPYTCLEQRSSKAVALRDEAAWKTVMASLPAHLDRDGLAKYFAGPWEGSDSLTAYLVAVAHEAGWALPEAAKARMLDGLEGFVAGRVIRHGSLPTADLTIRKVAALEALSRHRPEMDAALVGSFVVDPDRWPTSAVIDWLALADRWTAMPDRDAQRAKAAQVLRARINVQGTTMNFSTEASDRLWWLMVSPDVNANRALLALMDDPAWEKELPRMARGSLGRQQAGHWNTTVANAWGVMAMERFGNRFEAEAVTGETTASMGTQKRSADWAKAPAGSVLDVPWPTAPASLAVSHDGTGRPWITVQSRAAVPLTAPLASGYRIQRTVTAVSGDPKHPKRGDVQRVTLEIDADADMTWVVVSDPVPAGASILGSGLGGDTGTAPVVGGDRDAWVRPVYEERAFEGFRAYYRFVPKGRVTLAYDVRLNNVGTFTLPSTRVEAMYAPEMFGEVPNPKLVVGDE